MSLFDAAKDTITNLATTDIIKERLALAMDQATILEKKVTTLQEENAVLKFQLKECQRERSDDQAELNRLQKMLEETVRIARGIEFRLGPRTGNTWQPFCPICHLPIVTGTIDGAYTALTCSNGKCNWFTDLDSRNLPHLISTLT